MTVHVNLLVAVSQRCIKIWVSPSECVCEHLSGLSVQNTGPKIFLWVPHTDMKHILVQWCRSLTNLWLMNLSIHLLHLLQGNSVPPLARNTSTVEEQWLYLLWSCALPAFRGSSFPWKYLDSNYTKQTGQKAFYSSTATSLKRSRMKLAAGMHLNHSMAAEFSSYHNMKP